jgi:hypothetical protein
VIIEIESYSVDDVDAFCEVDERVQTEVVYGLPGLRRRTTARSDEGWVTITVWDTWTNANAGRLQLDAHPQGSTRAALCARDHRLSTYETLG